MSGWGRDGRGRHPNAHAHTVVPFRSRPRRPRLVAIISRGQLRRSVHLLKGEQ